MEDAIVNFPGAELIGCCNELNAAYAADGYARIRGVGAVNTTYGAGELGAFNAIAGAYAEHLPVFHLVGMPTTARKRPAPWCIIPWKRANSTFFGRWRSPPFAPARS